jgi:hypothetical protein
MTQAVKLPDMPIPISVRSTATLNFLSDFIGRPSCFHNLTYERWETLGGHFSTLRRAAMIVEVVMWVA